MLECVISDTEDHISPTEIIISVVCGGKLVKIHRLTVIQPEPGSWLNGYRHEQTKNDCD